MVLTCWPKSP